MKNGENFLVGELLCAALGCECRQAESAPGEGEDGACSSISAQSSSFPLFPSHPECWCLDSWSSEQLESGTARLPWAFLKQQPVPAWLWPSQGTGWPSSPKTTLTPSLPGTGSQFLSSCPTRFLWDSPGCSQAWQGCPRYTPGSAGPSLPFPCWDDLFIRYLNIVVQYPGQGWGDGGFTCF